MNDNCGLINENATCNCKKRIPVAIDRKRLIKDNLNYYKESSISINDYVRSMNILDKMSNVYRTSPFYEFDVSLKLKLEELINSSEHKILEV